MVELQNPNVNAKPTKLRRLPKHARVLKRPLLHPPISSPHSGKDVQKVVYISSSTHFISAVKRVRKLLDAIDKRETGNVNLLSQRKDNGKTVQTGRRGKGEAEEVSLKATARAIEKALNLAIFFQGQEDCKVRIRTGSVGVVDDIVEVKKSAGQAESSGSVDNRLGKSLKRKRSESDVEDNDAGVDRATEPTEPNSAVIEDEVLPETQIRKTSMVEVLISLR